MSSPAFYIIIFPGGDRSKIEVHEMHESYRYEVDEYAVASRKEFKEGEKDEAISYAKKLAKENDLEYVGDTDGYLD